ncbi:MAG: secondary thiamine-phosphate synthase enzyme [Afipia sp. 62-7]|nr:YjbQ family protein [Afipia sp.]OJU21295.1 MAG: secondary thiamine-phosphate synthase enzyme [Afipia sp. 62-7]
MKHSSVMSTSVDVIATSVLTVPTRGEGFTDITRKVARFLDETGGRTGVASLFIRHTSASLTVQENADPDVLADLLTSLRRLAPADGGWRHTIEGPDDMPAHIKTMLTSVSLQIPVIDGALALGTWQAIYLIEHRARPHSREVVMQFMGSK